MRLTTPISLILTLLLFSATSAWSADWNKGVDAFDKGDFATALREWEPLAEQGNVLAQNILGLMYENGQGVSQDYSTAFKWYSLAAEQGDADAQFFLGSMYYNGEGVPQDYSTAFKWYSLAAEQGNADAQFNLGVMHVSGWGVTQDKVYAHMWLNIAASQGGEDAANSRDIIAKSMTPADISAAEKHFRECVKKNYKSCGPNPKPWWEFKTPYLAISMVLAILLYLCWLNRPRSPLIGNAKTSFLSFRKNWLIVVVLLQGAWLVLSWWSSFVYYSDEYMKVFFSNAPIMMYGELLGICIGLFLVSYTFYLLVATNRRFKIFFIYQFIFSILQVPFTARLGIYVTGETFTLTNFLSAQTPQEWGKYLVNIVYGVFVLLYVTKSSKVRKLFGH